MTLKAEDLDEVFNYHLPNEAQQIAYVRIRTVAREMAAVIINNTTVCGDQQAALRHLRIAVMEANAAVALKGRI